MLISLTPFFHLSFSPPSCHPGTVPSTRFSYITRPSPSRTARCGDRRNANVNSDAIWQNAGHERYHHEHRGPSRADPSRRPSLRRHCAERYRHTSFILLFIKALFIRAQQRDDRRFSRQNGVMQANSPYQRQMQAGREWSEYRGYFQSRRASSSPPEQRKTCRPFIDAASSPAECCYQKHPCMTSEQRTVVIEPVHHAMAGIRAEASRVIHQGPRGPCARTTAPPHDD